MTVLLGKLAAFQERAVVNSLENFSVEVDGFGGVEVDPEDGEGVRKSLDADSDRPVPHVRVLSLFDRVVVEVDDLVQVPDDDPGDLDEPFMVELAVLDELGERDGGEVANCDFVFVSVFDNLGAEVG